MSSPPSSLTAGSAIRVPDCALRRQCVQPDQAVRDTAHESVRKPFRFHDFDSDYVASLCAGDLATQEHFVQYFTELIHLKLRTRLRSPHAIEDVRQETFARVFACLRGNNVLRQPERLGAFVNAVCNNVLSEHYRLTGRIEPFDEVDHPEPATSLADACTIVAGKQLNAKIRQILLALPRRDRALLRAVFLEERDRDEVCSEFGVDRDYLRVLLYRAKQEFKSEFVKLMGQEAWDLQALKEMGR